MKNILIILLDLIEGQADLIYISHDLMFWGRETLTDEASLKK
jgi:hypothetical protein